MNAIKLTVGFCAFLIFAVVGASVWAGMQRDQTKRDLASVRNSLKLVGEYSGQIDVLLEEQKQDRLAQYDNQPLSFFMEMGRQSGIDANQDYDTNPKDVERYDGYQDQEFQLNFRKGREMDRLNLLTFAHKVEVNSPRVKLVSARLTLDTKQAVDDKWKATLVFLRRDPYSGE